MSALRKLLSNVIAPLSCACSDSCALVAVEVIPPCCPDRLVLGGLDGPAMGEDAERMDDMRLSCTQLPTRVTVGMPCFEACELIAQLSSREQGR